MLTFSRDWAILTVEIGGAIGKRLVPNRLKEVTVSLGGREVTSFLLHILSNYGMLLLALHERQAVSTSLWREVMPMVTYESLFAYSLVIIGLVGLIVQIYKRK